MKIITGIILGLAILALVIFIIAGANNNVDDTDTGDETVVINRFVVEDEEFVIEGSGFVVAEVFANVSGVDAERSLGQATSNEANVWTLSVPESPLLIEALYAVGLNTEGNEVVRKQFGAVGIPEIYGNLYLDVPIEYLELGEGDSIEFSGATITLDKVVSDESCDRQECRDGRDATVAVTVAEADQTNSGNVTTTTVGESVGSFYVSVTDVEPAPGSNGDYLVTLAVSRDIKG